VSVSYLEVSGLKKSYGLKPALRGIDLAVERGQRVALLGANGAGKTTLLRILACLAKPDAGTARIDGLDIVRDALEVRAQVGFVAHQPYLYEELTALENLLFFGRMYAVPQSKARALTLLERVGLAKRANERASALSRGQMQRLSLARALLHDPHLLLLDEPDTGLDEDGITLLESLLQEHSEGGGTLLFTTHILERALRWSGRIGLLSNGRMVSTHETSGLAESNVREIYAEALG
jgi:heme ABC exporter ATP-binding subunit CcmA